MDFGFSNTRPVPSATQDSGSSAMETGSPVSSRSTWSRLASSEPPPVSTMPLSTMSAASSGGVALGDGDFLRHAVQQVASLDLERGAVAVGGRRGRADLLLDALGTGFADQQILMAPDIGDDGFVHLVAADAHRTHQEDTAERQHCHFRGAA